MPQRGLVEAQAVWWCGVGGRGDAGWNSRRTGSFLGCAENTSGAGPGRRGGGGLTQWWRECWSLASSYSVVIAGSFFFFFFNLFIYFWLCWVFVSVRGLSPVAASGGHSSSRCAGLSRSRPLLLRSTGSRRAGSVIVAHGPSCSVACGIFPDQGSNPCPLRWQADSQPLCHQGSPLLGVLTIGLVWFWAFSSLPVRSKDLLFESVLLTQNFENLSFVEHLFSTRRFSREHFWSQKQWTNRNQLSRFVDKSESFVLATEEPSTWGPRWPAEFCLYWHLSCPIEMFLQVGRTPALQMGHTGIFRTLNYLDSKTY